MAASKQWQKRWWNDFSWVGYSLQKCRIKVLAKMSCYTVLPTNLITVRVEIFVGGLFLHFLSHSKPVNINPRHKVQRERV